MARHVDMQMLTDGPLGSGRIDTDWLARHLRFNFYLNRLAAGDRLPSVRELARTLRISPNTAVELYKELENAGLVETRPRSGTFLRRVAKEEDRTARDLTVFAMMVRLARRLELMAVSPADFANLFLRYTGMAPRENFTFAFISSGERFQILQRQLASRLKWRLPFTVLPPSPRAVPSARERIAGDSSIRCLLSSYVHCDEAFRLAEEFNLPVIVERLDPGTAAIFEPPPAGTRYILTRDREFADGIRQLTDSAYPPERARRMVVAALDEPERLADFERAEEIVVSPLALDAASIRFDPAVRLVPLRLEISQETIEALLSQYVFVTKDESGTEPARTPPRAQRRDVLRGAGASGATTRRRA